MLCEVRTPTFRRPVLLERALRSLLAQSHADWRCIVLDDCPQGSAEPVVRALGDSRIALRRNPVPLGAIGNIDQAFRNRAYAGGETAMVLEDDNYLFTDHLETQIRHMAEQRVDVIFSAQRCEKVVKPGLPGELLDERTIAWIYPQGRQDWRSLLPAVLFSHGFSNGAAFWRLGGASDFEIGPVTRRPGIQETLRLLKLRDCCYVSHTPTAVWRGNDPIDSFVSVKTSGVAGRLDRLRELREMQDYRRWYLSRFGTGDAIAFSRLVSPQHAGRIARALVLCGYESEGHPCGREALFLRAKGLAFRAAVPRQLDLDQLETRHATESMSANAA